MTSKIWRGGMIGAGAWSETQLAAWSKVHNAKIVALTDRHPDRRAPIVEKFKIPRAFDDFETMLSSVELDFVDICTRPYSHAQLIKLAVARRLPVLCQKPFCQTLQEAREVTALCRRAKVPLMINENFRWQAWYRKAKELLDSGMLGRPFFARLHQRRRLTLPRFNHYQRYFTEMLQLLILEVGTHLFDVSRFLFGDPDTVYARAHHISPEVKGEDVYTAILGYPALTVVIHDSWASVPIPGMDRPSEHFPYYPRLLQVDGTLGTLAMMPDGSVHLYRDQDSQCWEMPHDTMEYAHTAALKHFIECLESGTEFETTGEETIKTMAVVYAAYRSAEEGRVVHLHELLEVN